QGKPFDVVITDLGMPDINGREVLRAVKARSPQTPVIILSGWGVHPANGQGKVPISQADAVLTKPPRLETLSATLARVMRGRHTGESRGGETESNLP
ncbi:MAG TPA: response regulator, partial [Chloroflexi bacterium]|nr:response regulator [Chloroflexota bacterium]